MASDLYKEIEYIIADGEFHRIDDVHNTTVKIINICMDATVNVAEKSMLVHGYTDRFVLEAIESLKAKQ